MLPAATLKPAFVHAGEHLRPVLRLGATGSGLDAENGAPVVVRPGQQHFQFIRIDFSIEMDQFGISLSLDRILTGLWFGFAQFEEY